MPDPAALLEALRAAAPEARLIEEAQAVLFPGCAALLEAPDEVRAAFRVLDALRIDYVGAPAASALCCGYPLHAAGLEREFAETARRVDAALARHRLVIAMDSRCAHVLRDLYADLDLPVSRRIKHVAEFLEPEVIRTARPPLDERHAIHDPCGLARRLGVVEQPRRMLRAALSAPLTELRNNREATACCGAGGLLPATSPGTAGAIAERLCDMAVDAGAESLVTSCTGCAVHIRKTSPKRFAVHTICGVLDRWLGRHTGSGGNG
jgi:Fe-S oxidoreductase